ncbi:lytic transglycosylase domain-containing protein [Trinickia caryophylli]|uniref:lytic transglycosylase domain-containing protein n=1 Tax=Trinickia caryophylli TaxID=28094 RepID=UPI000C888CA1|nr:lytic transglycosylase domain-containing protein [Trinickia caryophylli]PMS13165.1 lytic transglycosylase [Trinickia caryophylli]
MNTGLRVRRMLAFGLACAALVLANPSADARAGAPSAQSPAFVLLARTCAPNVDASTLSALVRTESGFNPFAIGVVGAHLSRQPASLAEALATVAELEARGYSYSVGLTQVNNRNFAKYGETAASLFEPCRNLRVGGAILTGCFARSSRAAAGTQLALRAALSCYYSGNFTTGFSSGYVAQVVSNARRDALRSGAEPIPLVRDPGGAPVRPRPAVRPVAAPGPAATAAGDAPAALPIAPKATPAPVRSSSPSCHGRPLVMVCRGLSAARIRSLCVRCLDAN